MTYENKVDYS